MTEISVNLYLIGEPDQLVSVVLNSSQPIEQLLHIRKVTSLCKLPVGTASRYEKSILFSTEDSELNLPRYIPYKTLTNELALKSLSYS